MYTFYYTKNNKDENDFWKDFYKLLNNSFRGKTMENVRKRVKIDSAKKDDNEKIVKQHPKLTISRIHKCFTIHDSYTFKHNEVRTDKPIYLGIPVLELGKLHMYESYYDKLQPYSAEKIFNVNILIRTHLY